MSQSEQVYLLTGAGFSANWGGWVASEAFEYLLGCPEVLSDEHLRDLLWECQLKGGFEDALAELQTRAQTGSDTDPQLLRLQNAVGRMFDDMNLSFRGRGDLEFMPPSLELLTSEQRTALMKRTIWYFLTRFRTIFTLNQDLLLEHLYFSKAEVRSAVKPELPGLQRVQRSDEHRGESWGDSDWVPSDQRPASLSADHQMYVKLHGSANWYSSNGSRVLIIGGMKQSAIGASGLLKSYLAGFERAISAANSRLMVIGYGFRDNHVNEVLERAIEKGLRLFVIDPHGAELAFKMNRTRSTGIAMPTQLEGMLRRAVIGGSRRRLSEIFGGNQTEYNKIVRFFDE